MVRRADWPTHACRRSLIGRRTPVDGRSLVDAFLTHSAPTTDARVAARVRVRQTVGCCRRRVTVCARRFGARSEALEQTIALLLDMRDAVEHKLAIDHILVAECGVQVRRLLPTFMQIEPCRRLRACASRSSRPTSRARGCFRS